MVISDLTGVGPVGIDGVENEDEREEIVFLIDPQHNSVGLKYLIGSEHLLDEDINPALNR